MNMFTGDMADTRTYCDRQWAFIGRTDPTAEGTLLIRQRRGTREEIDRYLVEEQAPPVGAMGRAFLLAKQTGENAEVYHAIIGPLSWCDCKSAKTHSPTCKHRDAVRSMIDDGAI